MDDNNDTEPTDIEPLDLVPENVDGVAFFSGDIIQDQATEELMNGSIDMINDLDPEYDGPASWNEMLTEFEDETNIQTNKFQSTLVFFEEDEGGLEDPYGGMIISSDLSPDELKETFDEEPPTKEYSDVTIWVEEETDQDVWIATLGNGTYVLGDEDAVRDVIDTHQDTVPAFSGELRQSYEEASDGLMKMAVNIPAEEVEDYDHNVSVMTMTYYTETTQMNMEAQLTMETEEDADQTAGALNLFLDEMQHDAETNGEEEIAAMIDRVTVESEDTQLQATFYTNPDELLDLLEEIMMGQPVNTEPTVSTQPTG